MMLCGWLFLGEEDVNCNLCIMEMEDFEFLSFIGVICLRIELLVCLDIVGGWSDILFWSFERIGCVLNMVV